MIAHADPSGGFFSPRSTPSITADALTRIPSAFFRDIEWAKDSIERCTAMLARTIDGDRGSVARWVRDAGAACGAQPLIAVLDAVSGAIIADAFRSRVDVAQISEFIASVEHDVLMQLTSDNQQKDLEALNDPDTADFAAGLVRIVRMHDPHTATHLEATAALARRIAIAMQLPLETVVICELAGRLHDIGKAGVRSELLTKAGPLTAAEWDELRRTAENGAAALAEIPRLAFLAPIVRAHRERFDGAGLPDRLRGSEIPLEARVVAVADAFHAMTTDHPYRRAMMPGDALTVLSDRAGSQFDASVVEATFVVFRFSRRANRNIA